MNTLIFLLAGHALCDFPLQGEFLSKGKNENTAFPGINWRWCMFAHCFIHAGMVLLITHIGLFAWAEFMIHYATDWLTCNNKISFNQDQLIHYSCKVIWAYGVWRMYHV